LQAGQEWPVKIETFALERWMVAHELDVEYDITESGIYPMSLRELLDLAPVVRGVSAADVRGVSAADVRGVSAADVRGVSAAEGERGALLDRLLDTRLGYSEARGTHELRAELASTYANTGPDNVLVTTGAIEANFLLFNVLLQAGDHVVAVHPAYQQLYSVPRAIGCEVDLWRLTPENGFRFDLDDLERLVRPETKLIVINTPHNPTGAALTEEELRGIYALAAASDAWLLCDEAYRWLELPGGAPGTPPGRDLGQRAISTGTFSKPFGLPGLRIGWLVAPEEIVEACWRTRDYVSLSPGKLNDAMALHALRNRAAVVARNRKIVQENLATVEVWLERNREFVRWVPPKGGLLALLAYTLDIPSMDLANRLADEYSVMLAPGSAFDYEHHLRIGLGQRPDVFAAGLERTTACFADLRAGGVEYRA
jgi:aspartate/methionine/tyrosine aminotransferase